MAELDPDAVAALLASVLPGRVTVAGWGQLTGGASAETWSLDVTDGAGAAHALIVRRGTGGGGIGLDARLEPLVQRAAYQASVPVARVVAVFADDPALGTGY